jgi:hypothetical protein
MKLSSIYINNKRFDLELSGLKDDQIDDSIKERCYLIALAHLAEKPKACEINLQNLKAGIPLSSKKIGKIFGETLIPFVKRYQQEGYTTTRQVWEGKPLSVPIEVDDDDETDTSLPSTTRLAIEPADKTLSTSRERFINRHLKKK